MLPKVSVIVPVFNAEEFLPECIESILAQTYPCFEVIVIDDGSLDLSGKICDDFSKKDVRIRVFHETNAGVSAARNRGLTEVRGEWIIFVDADDFIEPNYLESFLTHDHLETRNLVFQGYKKIFSNHVMEFPLVKKSTQKKTIVANNLLLYWGILGKMLNAGIVKRLNLRFDEGSHLGEDAVFFFRYLAEIEHMSVIEKTGYNYRNTGSSLSKRNHAWEVHYRGSRAICEVAFPQINRFLHGCFFYKRRILNLLTYEQYALRLDSLYQGGRSVSDRIQILRHTFGNRRDLLCTLQPLFSSSVKYSLLWGALLLFPYGFLDKLLFNFFNRR
jgi:glycosyltransferase involved in cell wall biosynthesis